MALTSCSHVSEIKVTRDHKAIQGCEDCLRMGSTWVHLRMCLSCGHVGCCDSSTHKHARAHFSETTHPIIQSVEAGEKWGWCYVDQGYLKELPLPQV